MSKLNFSILAISRCSAQYRTEAMAPYGLKGCHTSYLLHICAHPGISQDRLAQRIYINKSNVARQAAFLEEQGYITRTASATDKRVLELYPTDKALELLPTVRRIVSAWDGMLTKGLSDEQIATVSAVLEQMQETAGAWMEEH